MAGIQDIAAMKLNAIAVNGTRLKDFIDIAYISSFITPIQIVEAYQDKYSARNPVMAIKSMIYHNDINFTEPIEMMVMFVPAFLSRSLFLPDSNSQRLRTAGWARRWVTN